MRSVFAVATLLLTGVFLTACQQTAPQDIQASAESCDAQAVQSLLGKTATPDLLEQARTQSGAQTARVLRPDDVVTLEYNAQRLNLSTDDALIIQRINCG